jgi:hypothetical protein
MDGRIELALLAIGFSAVVTAWSAPLVDRALPGWRLWQRLALASLITPALYTVFQLVIFGFLGGLPQLFERKALSEVLVGPALRLWACSALCVGALGLLRARSSDQALAGHASHGALVGIFFACCAAIVLPIAMRTWIDTGDIAYSFLLVILLCSVIGTFATVVFGAVALFWQFGGAGLRWAMPAACAYAAYIIIVAFRWHEANAAKPGAWAIFAVSASALFGVLVALTLVRRWERA